MMRRLLTCAVLASLCVGSVVGQAPPEPKIGDKVAKPPPNAIIVSEEVGAAMRSPSAEVLAAMEELERNAPSADGADRGVRLEQSTLETELRWRVELDQYWRTVGYDQRSAFSEQGDRLAFGRLVGERMAEVDEANTGWLKGVIAERGGWPKISEVGVGVSGSLWLIAQHADRDRGFQKEVLALMEPLLEEGEVTARNYAYLYDRLAVAENRPQRYGTQGRCIDEDGRPAMQGAWAPNEIEEPEGVDTRRKNVGLGFLADYTAGFAERGACD